MNVEMCVLILLLLNPLGCTKVNKQPVDFGKLDRFMDRLDDPSTLERVQLQLKQKWLVHDRIRSSFVE